MNFDFTRHLKKIEVVLDKNLPKTAAFDWQRLSFGRLNKAVKKTHIKTLIDPCRKLVLLGGKRWRPLFMVLCGKLALEKNGICTENIAAYESRLEKIYTLSPLIELVHTASLIHDDIEDGSDMRRGEPAAYITCGLDTALNAGSWLYFEAAACIEQISDSTREDLSLKASLYAALMLELRRLHLGQAMDIHWHTNNEVLPRPDEYKAMAALKTGTLASLAARIGILAGGGASEEAEKIASFAADIGLGFQILDDIKNLTSGNIGKKRGDDIVEGKKSLPVLLHLAQHPQDFSGLMDCFKRAKIEGISSSAIEEAISIIEKSKALEQAKKQSIKLITGACLAIKEQYTFSTAALSIEQLFTGMLL